MQARLAEEEQNTAVLENEGTADMGLSDLYSYAVGHLGMQEASGDDITEMGPLGVGLYRTGNAGHTEESNTGEFSSIWRK